MRSKRDFLREAGAVVVASGVPFGRSLGAVIRPVPSRIANLSVTIRTSSGEQIEFAGATSIELGEFGVPFARIVQLNWLARSQDKRFSVFFRPDRETDRLEVVVLFGDPTIGPAETMGAYTCDIYDGGRSVATLSVPIHYWLGRWRWQSSPRSAVRTPSDLVRLNRAVPYRQNEMTAHLPRAARPYEIMGHSDITLFFGETGERSDIGQIPDVAAAYMATQDEAAYNSMMAWAESAASAPWHLNDPLKNGILNWDDWPTASTYESEHQKVPFHIAPKPFPSTCMRPDAAHHPCLSYVPFMITGDPFHFEELQYQINYYLGLEHGKKQRTYPFDAQTRGWAWDLRSVLFAYIAAEEMTSSAIIPRSFWKKVLDNNLAWIDTNCVQSKSPKEHVFSSGTSKAHMPWWQEDYLCAVLATAVRLGLNDWLPILRWKVQSNLNRLSGTSGWPRTHPTIYYAQFFSGKVTPKPTNVGSGTIDRVGLFERASIPRLGDWTIELDDELSFRVYGPEHRSDSPGKGMVGKKYSSGYGPQFVVQQGPKPFAPGDGFSMQIAEVVSWAELASTNGVAESRELQGSEGVYMAHLFAAMALSSSVIPEAKPLLDWLADQMRNAGCTIPWRDSFAI